MSQQQVVHLDDITVQLTRKNIKNLNLRITSYGEVRLSAPMHCPQKMVYDFLYDRQAWIVKQVHRLRQRNDELTKSVSLAKNSVLFLGKLYPINYSASTSERRVVLQGKKIWLTHKRSDNHYKMQILIDDWYRKQMASLLPDLIKKWEAVIKVQVLECRIKAMKTRWGTCNTRAKRIWLNLSLIKKPLICLEYVLVHEMIHLLEASHNKRFYALMNHFMPNWRSHQQQLYA